MVIHLGALKAYLGIIPHGSARTNFSTLLGCRNLKSRRVILIYWWTIDGDDDHDDVVGMLQTEVK